VVLIIAASSKREALESRVKVLTDQRWDVLQTREKSTLIEKRIREAAGAVMNAYDVALRRGSWGEVFPDHFASGKKGANIRAPRMDEQFIDRVIHDAGGRRLTSEEKANEQIRNADYLLLNHVIELKDIQEEGLEKPERQAKLARLFLEYSDRDEILIDASILSDDHLLRYADIIGEPLKSQIKSAGQQIKSTKSHLSDEALKGGVILLNSGYFTLPAEVFHDQACRYAQKDSSHIDFVVTLTAGFATDGFNSWFNFQFLPSPVSSPIEEVLGEAVISNERRFMTEWARKGFEPPNIAAPVPAPVTFVYDGKRFTYYPAGLPPPWTPESMTGRQSG
jgi:hypothetical protein